MHIDFISFFKTCINKYDFSRASMEFYRGKAFLPRETELRDIIMEKEAIEATSKSAACKSQLSILMSLDFLRPFKCVAVLYVLLSLSGLFIITNYSASFFEVW